MCKNNNEDFIVISGYIDLSWLPYLIILYYLAPVQLTFVAHTCATIENLFFAFLEFIVVKPEPA